MRFVLEADTLFVKFEGVEQFWAVKRKLSIPKADITALTWDETVTVPKTDLGLRMGGVGVPGLLYAGQFMAAHGLTLVYLHGPRKEGGNVIVNHVLTIGLRNSRFVSFIFTVEDPYIAERIIAWWSSAS